METFNKGEVNFVIFVMTFIAMCLCQSSFAQTQKNADALGRDYSLAERFSYRTNALEWVLTIPNVGMEFDLSKSQYNRQTLGVTAKYNWNTYHRYNPSSVLNLFEIRPEYRYYYRHTQRKPRSASDTSKMTFTQWWKDRVWTTDRDNPKLLRAYYWGVYANYTGYSLKLGNIPGYQGQSIGFGVSWGYDVPRYQYKKCAIDVEFGFSLGLQMTRYDKFSHTTDGYFYVPIPEKSRNWHLTPFPVISEAKVAFVLRPVSVEHKYVAEDPVVKQIALAKSDISYEIGLLTRQNFDDTHEDMLQQCKADWKMYVAEFRKYLDEEAESAESRAVEQVKDEKARRTIHNFTNSRKLKSMLGFYMAIIPEFVKQKAAEKAEAKAEAKKQKEEQKKKEEEESKSDKQ